MSEINSSTIFGRSLSSSRVKNPIAIYQLDSTTRIIPNWKFLIPLMAVYDCAEKVSRWPARLARWSLMLLPEHVLDHWTHIRTYCPSSHVKRTRSQLRPFLDPKRTRQLRPSCRFLSGNCATILSIAHAECRMINFLYAYRCFRGISCVSV